MNPELQKCRAHYESLPRNVRERTTAQMLLKAIQIAEKYESFVQEVANIRKTPSGWLVKGDEPYEGESSRLVDFSDLANDARRLLRATSSAQPASSSPESA